MKRLKVIISIFVALAALLIIWRVGFYPPVPEQPDETAVVTEPAKPGEVAKAGDANEPVVASDANEPSRFADAGMRRGPGRRPGRMETGGDSFRPRRITDVNDANEPMEALNLKDIKMSDIIKKIAEWTGKTVIPNDEAMKQKITVYAPDRLPRNKALMKIYSALRLKGYIVEQMDDTIYIKPIAEGKFGLVPTIPADQPLAMIENKDQLAQRFFKLTNYNPSQMGQVIQPLVGEYGYVSADETTSNVLVIDTVANLIRIERIILELDVSQAAQMEQEIFEIRHGNPEEIVQLLQTLLGDGSSSVSGSDRRARQRSDRPGAGSKGGATTVTVGTGRTPMTLIAEPTNSLIIAKASSEDMEQIRQWISKLDKPVPTITTEYPLASIENKNQVMQYFFRLKNYSPTQMAQVVEPLLSDNGYVSADESTRQLLVNDTVGSLINIEKVVKQFDVPEAEQTVTQYFEIKNGDPTEIVQLLRLLISGETGTSSRNLGRSGSSRSSYSSSRSSYMSSSSRSSSRSGLPTSVMIGPSQQPVVLIPVPRLKWIIARASAEDMKRIDEWIQKLDTVDPVKSEHETVPVRFVDPSEVAERLNEALQQVTGSELQANVLVQPLVQAKQIMIFGRADMRAMVKKLIQEIDIPSGLETRIFKLEHADADQIKENIDSLYGEQLPSTSYYSSSALYYYYRYGRSQTAVDIVKVIAFPTMQQVTVIASPENLIKIEEQIKEWDIPLDVEQVKPIIIELKNSDPVEMANLLRTLFSEDSDAGMSYWDFWYGSEEDKKKIVGPLYGQLTFEEVPGTKKIIVISKIPAAYDVIKQIVFDLDRQEMAEVPKVVQLKYADPEDLAERLNAMFNEPGTTAPIRYSAQGLGDYSMEEDAQDNQSSGSSSDSGGQSTQGTYTPWWSGGGARSGIDQQMPISNVIGRIRFVPDPHSKSILVLAPVEFIDRIEELIHQLDIPGKQVMIKAVIVEIDHKSMTSLGLQLASNTSTFGTLGENSLTIGPGETAGSVLRLLEKHGGLIFGSTNQTGNYVQLDVDMDVTALVDFLVKKVNAKILNQQTLWTKDNEEASFFKGDKVAFFTSSTLTGTGSAQQSFEFQRVGMTLAARPSITPEKRVDMVINVILSQLTGDLVNSQPARTEMETRTNMIVQDGQTIMLGGILFQKESVIKRKIPLFGDLPLAGGLFRHSETLLANNELIVFITPYVIDEPGERLPETTAEIEGPRQKLEGVREELKDSMEKLQEELEKE